MNETDFTIIEGSQGTSTYAVTLTTNGTATLTNSMMMNNLHINSIVDIMKERNIPAYMGDEYFGLAWPTTWRPVKNLLEGVYQYRDEGFQMIYNGEIGKCEGVRLIEQTGIPHGNYSGSDFSCALHGLQSAGMRVSNLTSRMLQSTKRGTAAISKSRNSHQTARTR